MKEIKYPYPREDEGNSHTFQLEVTAQHTARRHSDTTVQRHE